MVKAKYEKGAVLVTGSDPKHIEIYRFKETVELEKRTGGWYKDGKLVDPRQYCVRCPKNEAAKILARLKCNGNIKVETRDIDLYKKE